MLIPLNSPDQGPSPLITFHFPDGPSPVGPQDPRWHTPLPSQAAGPSVAPRDGNRQLTFGDYFSAIARFLARDDFADLQRALAAHPRFPGKPNQCHIQIVSEKHGALYHPARIALTAAGSHLDLAVNLAFSVEGCRALPQEVENLLRLEVEFGLPYTPRVFGSGTEVIDGCRSVALFLGEWFSGCFEFHLARNPLTGIDGLHLWDPHHTARFLDPAQTSRLFHQAAQILTSYYNPLSTEQIFPWHHAAGDFIWGDPADGSLQGLTDPVVRLVTVRGYQPLLADFAPEPELADVVDGLVLFFLNMVLRMRLDRREGVGAPGWIDGAVIGAILAGFREGLTFMTAHHGLPADFPGQLCRYIRGIDQAELTKIYRGVIPRLYPPQGAEHNLVATGLAGHIRQLRQALREW